MKPHENPVLVWAVRRLRTEMAGIALGIVYLALVYGAAILSAVIWGTKRTRQWSELATALHYEAWGGLAILLLLVVPARLAQALARERERGTLEALRLTGMSGVQLALGQVGHAFMLPAVLAVLTLPVVLLGLSGDQGPMGGLRAYPNLLLLGLFYGLAAGVVGLASKKAQNAGGGAVFVLLCLLAAGGFYRMPYAESLGLLGPWGSLLDGAERELRFELPLWDFPAAGWLAQVPFLLAMVAALWLALVRRLSGDHAVLVGRGGALGLGVGLGVAAAVTFHSVQPGMIAGGLRLRPDPYAALILFVHLSALLVAVLPLALETPVRWQDLVRGLARREPDDEPFPDERLGPARFAPGPAVALGCAALMLPVVLTPAPVPPGGLRLTVEGLAVGAAVVASAWLLVALAIQAALLWTRDRGAPRALAALAIAAAWFGPLAAAWALTEMGLAPALAQLPRVLNPFYCVYMAACHTDPALLAGGGFDPLGLAVAGVTLNAFLCGGLVHLIVRGHQRAREDADSLVVLPGDAFGAPGTLTRRCPRGHLFAEDWNECPHCVAERPAPAEPAAAEPPPRDERTVAMPAVGDGAPAAGAEDETRQVEAPS